MRGVVTTLSVALIAIAPAVLAKGVHNRAIIADFVDRFYAQRDVAGAFAAHVAPDYIQHNPGLPDGAKVAVEVLGPKFAQAGAHFDVKHLLIDGDLALVHLFGQGTPGTPGAAVADIYRLKDGKVVEHWDVLQPVAPGSDPLAMAPAKPARPGDTARNPRSFQRFVDLLFAKGDVDGAYSQFVAPDLIQHNSRMGQGRDGAVAAIKGLRAAAGATFTVQRVLVDGNFAAVHYRGKLSVEDRGAAVVEIFRFENGRIVEHWDMFQPVPETSRNAHPMF